MTMPNFLIVGAMKCGTTALYYYLEQHPQIFMSPVKEPNFFCFEGREGLDSGNSITDIAAYRGLFRGVSSERAIGEASHCYLYEPRAVERIKHYTPDARLIAILRSPIERAYSHFLHAVRNGTECQSRGNAQIHTQIAEAGIHTGACARSGGERP